MNKQFYLFIFSLLGGLITIQAQSKQDSLFIRQMITNPTLIKGKAYYFEIEKQHSPLEYSKSLLIREKDTPEFDRRNELVNGLPFAHFKDMPVVFKKVTIDKVTVGTEIRPCFKLLFTCNKQNYCAYEFSKNLLRVRYRLIEADLLNKANKLLVGKTLYTKSPNWFVYDEKKLNSNLKISPVREGTCKYCPVTITRVVNNNSNNFLILFKPENQDEEYCFADVVLDSSKSNFYSYYTFENPRNQYPDISEERWGQIMSQKVRKGFTPDEVKIAYGKPDEIYGEDDDETWFFKNINRAEYAITFKDGIVDKVVSQTLHYQFF